MTSSQYPTPMEVDQAFLSLRPSRAARAQAVFNCCCDLSTRGHQPLRRIRYADLVQWLCRGPNFLTLEQLEQGIDDVLSSKKMGYDIDWAEGKYLVFTETSLSKKVGER